VRSIEPSHRSGCIAATQRGGREAPRHLGRNYKSERAHRKPWPARLDPNLQELPRLTARSITLRCLIYQQALTTAAKRTHRTRRDLVAGGSGAVEA